MRIFKKDIDFKSFLAKGIKDNRNDWGGVIVTGFQGSGKTYFCIKYALSKPEYTIKTNIQSLNIPNRKIEKFIKLGEIVGDTEKHKIYIIDEISKIITKESKQKDFKDFYTFLQQCRKKECLVLMTHQEFKDVPTWLRHTCAYGFNTVAVPFTPLLKTKKIDVQNAYLDENKEWVSDTLFEYIYKRTKKISSYYDTNEIIQTL